MPVNPVFQLFTSSRACLYFNITLPSVGYKKKKKKRGVASKLNLPNITFWSCLELPAGRIKKQMLPFHLN